MNSSPERQIRKFNPGTFQSDKEVIAQFVVRNRELGVVLEVVRGNIDSPSCQHIMVVAPRGRGKSMLLARFPKRCCRSGCVGAAHYCSALAHGRGGTRTNRDAGSRGGYPQTNREDHGNERAGGLVGAARCQLLNEQLRDQSGRE